MFIHTPLGSPICPIAGISTFPVYGHCPLLTLPPPPSPFVHAVDSLDLTVDPLRDSLTDIRAVPSSVNPFRSISLSLPCPAYRQTPDVNLLFVDPGHEASCM